ncbi:membrane protein, partial [mine drainage metagenome]
MPRYLKATYLADSEYLLEETRATKLFYFPGPIVWTVIWAAVAVLTLGPRYHLSLVSLPTLLSAQEWRYVGYAGGLLFLAGLLWILVRYLRWRSTVYAVTSRRVIVQQGILGRNFDEIPVTQVRGVDVHQTVGERILRYGTMRVSSEG